jgi:cytoskeletal protein RodZ
MPEESPVDFGTMFKQARERRGVSLQQVAAVTKISARVLDALERNDVSKLPGGIFSRAFVRSYAREIGLDPELAIERFITEFPNQSGKEQMPSAKEAEDIEAFESGRRVATTVIQLVGLSIIVIVGMVFALNSRACRKPAAMPPAASALVPVTPVPATQAPPRGEEPVALLKETPAVDPAATPQPPAGAAGSVSQAAAPIHLTIAAQAECWLRVKVDNDIVFERILRAGERLIYQAYASVTLSAGNAGGLSMTINGKPARPLGTPGQVVVKTITLDTLANFLQ